MRELFALFIEFVMVVSNMESEWITRFESQRVVLDD